MEPTSVTSDSVICQACGACCAYSADWPRFTLETDADIAAIPQAYLTLTGMRCIGDRCSALAGHVGALTSCVVYAHRPQVCRACLPGDDACTMARARHGLPSIAT